jgi:hypothetical protein
MLIALWFACADVTKLNKYGLLIGIETNVARRVQSEEELGAVIPDLVGRLSDREHYWLWEPRYLFGRMRVQQALFIFGEAIQWPWGSAPFALHATGAEYMGERSMRK